jgi:hypothetical protein
MTAANIGSKMIKVKYVYDYPENREVSKHLSKEDRALIITRTGFSYKYVNDWCRGTRKNRRIEEWARRIAKLNIAKQRKLNQSTDPSTN